MAEHTPGPWFVDTTVALGPYNILTGSDDILEACKLARAFGSTGDTHEGLSVSEFLRAAIAKAEGTADA